MKNYIRRASASKYLKNLVKSGLGQIGGKVLAICGWFDVDGQSHCQAVVKEKYEYTLKTHLQMTLLSYSFSVNVNNSERFTLLAISS